MIFYDFCMTYQRFANINWVGVLNGNPLVEDYFAVARSDERRGIQ